MYVMSSVFYEAQNITPSFIYRLAHPFGRNEVMDGHELGQKNEVEGQALLPAAVRSKIITGKIPGYYYKM